VIVSPLQLTESDDFGNEFFASVTPLLAAWAAAATHRAKIPAAAMSFLIFPSRLLVDPAGRGLQVNIGSPQPLPKTVTPVQTVTSRSHHVELLTMAASDATTIDADGREVRVSSADRVIFPATERTPEITKLQIVEYYLSVEDGIMRALRQRPTTLERWPKGVHPGMVISTREWSGGDAFFQKRVPKGAPDYLQTARIEFPSGRTADEICPTEIAVVAWCAQMGTITFHPWPVRSDDVDHPDEMRIDLDPQPGTDFADAVRVASTARELLGELGYAGFPKTSGGRGIHIYVRIEPKWTFTDVRHAAIAFGRELERRLPGEVTTKWWKEERGERIFVDYNQNARDRTIASAYSIRPKPGAPVSAPVTWDELGEVQPEDFTVATMPARFAEVGDHHAAIDDVHHSLQPLLHMYDRDETEGEGDMPYPPDYPKMPGEPKRVQPSRDKDRERKT
jgi:DNA ligase D